jgi:hypothetical protein
MACDKKQAPGEGDAPKDGAEATAKDGVAAVKIAASRDLAPLLDKHARWLPGDSLLVGALDVTSSLDAMMSLQNLYGVEETAAEKARREALLKDLGELSKARMGMDLTKADVILFGVGIMGPSVVALGVEVTAEDAVEVDGGVEGFQIMPRHPKDEEMMEGAEYLPWAMALPDGAGVALFPSKARLEAISGNADFSLAESDRREKYLKTLGKAPAYMALVGDIAFAANAAGGTEKTLGFPSPKFAAMSVGEELVVTFQGPEDGLAKVEEVRKAEQGKLGEMIDAEYAKRAEKNGLFAAAAIGGYHGFRMIEDAMLVTLEGDRLTYAVPSIYGGAFGMGVGAAIAIPAFTRYIKQSKVAEAELTLTMAANAVVTADGFSGECTFPPAPRASSTVPVGGEKVAPIDPDPAWEAFNISLEDPKYWAYDVRVEKGDAGIDAYVIRAQADFKAGGPIHTIEQAVRADRSADGACRLEVAPAVTTNEFE